VLKRFRYQIAIFLSVVGPGLITANVDNDSGGILTYSQAGAKYGYLPLWTLIPITLLLIAFLVYSAVKSWVDTLIVFTNIPVASAGGEGTVLRVVRPDIKIGRCPKETAAFV